MNIDQMQQEIADLKAQLASTQADVAILELAKDVKTPPTVASAFEKKVMRRSEFERLAPQDRYTVLRDHTIID
jgi:hypothetical protein